MGGVVLLCILPEGEHPGTEIANSAAWPLEGLTVSPLTLWFRGAPQAPAPSLEDVRAHHRIVAAAWAAHPAVLPVRFGQWFASPGELRAAVEPKLGVWAEALERVRGAGEFSVRLLDPALQEPVLPEATSGTEYLRAAAARARHRAAVEARGREAAQELARALGGLVKDERVDPVSTPHGLATVAHLVDRTREGEYEAAVDRFAAGRPELRLLRTGPWPAWSFTA